MREQHDTNMLEQVIKANAERLEGPAHEIKAASDRLTQTNSAKAHETRTAADAGASAALLKAQASRVFIVLMGLSFLVLAAGFAFWLVLNAESRRLAELPPPPVTSSTPAVAEAPAPIWPNMPHSAGATAGEDTVVTTNFSLFRTTDVTIGTDKFIVKAGHHYDKGTDTQFKHAWCYTQIPTAGVVLSVELGDKFPGLSPVIVTPTAAELDKTGLSQADHRKLFNACPWLDGNPDLSAVSPASTNNTYSFSGDVTAQSVDQLIAAVDNGASHITFDSPGGILNDAVRGFEVLKANDVNTVVNGECASACTILFLGGSKRSVDPGARVGVHQWDTIDGEADEAETQAFAGALVALFKAAGVREDFFIAGSQTSPEDMYWLSGHELRAWRVVNS
ncbi:ATP-dependent Clp protease proteolytic subunit [Shimia abyssi]|uniref:Uncharacterized protein n=1 Tax=Shimia abyssi TaxID=1662395 RepID=A0A2P8F2W2_9RHOB|nr:ATP-dependent Clp protease proteolytic subunit [Shimia abyssi]PSL16055.1 hypothetical protein CLV88_12322 [Shimia abyssi]